MIRTNVLALAATSCFTAHEQAARKCGGTCNSTFLPAHVGTDPHAQGLQLPGALDEALRSDRPGGHRLLNRVRQSPPSVVRTITT